MPETQFATTLIVCLKAGAGLLVSAGTVRWARIRRCRASLSHLASTAQNCLSASFPRSPDHPFPEFWFKTRDTQSVGSFVFPTAIYRALLQRCPNCGERESMSERRELTAVTPRRIASGWATNQELLHSCTQASFI